MAPIGSRALTLPFKNLNMRFVAGKIQARAGKKGAASVIFLVHLFVSFYDDSRLNFFKQAPLIRAFSNNLRFFRFVAIEYFFSFFGGGARTWWSNAFIFHCVIPLCNFGSAFSCSLVIYFVWLTLLPALKKNAEMNFYHSSVVLSSLHLRENVSDLLFLSVKYLYTVFGVCVCVCVSWYLCVCVLVCVSVCVCVFFPLSQPQKSCSRDKSRKEMEEKYSFSSVSHNPSVIFRPVASSPSVLSLTLFSFSAFSLFVSSR